MKQQVTPPLARPRRLGASDERRRRPHPHLRHARRPPVARSRDRRPGPRSPHRLRRAVLARHPGPVHHLAAAPPGGRAGGEPGRLRPPAGRHRPRPRPGRQGRPPLAVHARAGARAASSTWPRARATASWRCAARCRRSTAARSCACRPSLQEAHEHWQEEQLRTPARRAARRRARRLALSLLELGEDLEATERQLIRWKFHPVLCRESAAWAWDRHRQAHAAVEPSHPPDDAA